jgi:hypothetical protein
VVPKKYSLNGEIEVCFTLAVTGAGTWESVLVKQEPLVHVSSLFDSGYFGDGVLTFVPCCLES